MSVSTKNKKQAVVLINVGTPDKPTVASVRKYLFQFLNDRRVIDLPWLLQKILVNLIIVPFRAPKSTKLYKQLWTEKGSPLLYYTKQLVNKLQKRAEPGTSYFAAMRYGNPDLKDVLKFIHQEVFDEIILVPMYPQFASSSNGTSIQLALSTIEKWNTIPKLKIVDQFYNQEGFLNAFMEQARNFDITSFDHIVFSYHGLPMRQIQKTHPKTNCATCTCEDIMPSQGSYCYKATCYETSRLFAARLGLSRKDYSVSFQSRLSKNWLTPFTDKLLIEKAQQGSKRILVFAPAFVTDCLETIIEIGIEYKELFQQYGGEELIMVESLNDSEAWVNGLEGIITSS